MQTVNTPVARNVFDQHTIAPAGARIVAFLLDSVVLIIYLIVTSSVFINVNVTDITVWVVFVILPAFCFGVTFELLMNGQTPGKRIMGLKVIKLDGTRPGPGHYLLRWVCGLIDFIFLFGALAVIIISSGGKGQRLGDLVAGTCVVKVMPQYNQALTPPYIPLFPQVIQLDSYYLELIDRALRAQREHDNFTPVWKVDKKIKSLLNIETDLPPVQFLSVLVKDFNHLNNR